MAKEPKETSKVYAQEWLNMDQERWRQLKLIWIAASEFTMKNWLWIALIAYSFPGTIYREVKFSY